MQNINWNEQWALHAPYFDNGIARVPLSKKQEIILKPGPGFGDFSHPTTQLMIHLMTPYILKAAIYDIGCGSGILSLAALKLGAKTAIGVDIDPEAVEHAKENARLNKLSAHFSLKRQEVPCDIVLMNMIFSEQKLAWKTHQRPAKWIVTSGILNEQKEAYLEQARLWNWELVEERSKEGWLALLFKNK